MSPTSYRLLHPAMVIAFGTLAPQCRSYDTTHGSGCQALFLKKLYIFSLPVCACVLYCQSGLTLPKISVRIFIKLNLALMEKRAAVAQERFAFAGSELQLKAHKVRSGAAAVKFCLPNLEFAPCRVRRYSSGSFTDKSRFRAGQMCSRCRVRPDKVFLRQPWTVAVCERNFGVCIRHVSGCETGWYHEKSALVPQGRMRLIYFAEQISLI